MQPTDVLYKHKKSESLEKTPMTPIETPQVNYFTIEFFTLKISSLLDFHVCKWYDDTWEPLKSLSTNLFLSIYSFFIYALHNLMKSHDTSELPSKAIISSSIICRLPTDSRRSLTWFPKRKEKMQLQAKDRGRGARRQGLRTRSRRLSRNQPRMADSVQMLPSLLLLMENSN